MGDLFELDRTWSFPCSAEALWATLERVDLYTSWWPWLKRFDAHPPSLRRGATARCVAKPAVVPIAMRFRIDIVDVVPARLLAIEVHGDLLGTASLHLTPVDDAHADVRVAWNVDLQHRSLGPLARLAGALAPRGQEWVVRTSMKHFRRGALGDP
ncbi:MAG: SRPBCC family protein [Actinomycetota bacterium]|nr:SRPBCC family protein [Actinomycetota bacterium]